MKQTKTATDEKTLRGLKQAGVESAILDLRLEYQSVSSILKYIKPLEGKDRAHPHMLPTQKSLRWSTTNPPLPNFSANCINPTCRFRANEHRNLGSTCWSLRDVVLPDSGFYFLKWDLDAIEAKLAAAYSHDQEDLEYFKNGYDIHTRTACEMFGLRKPSNYLNPHGSPEDYGWRLDIVWGGKEDWRRTVAKCARFSLAYGTDERAILQAKDTDQLDLSRDELVEVAAAYLASKPHLVAFKKRVWDHLMKTHEVRHPLGGRKRLFITPEEYSLYKRTQRATPSCREGLNHLFQGWVAVVMNLMIIETKQRFPYMRFGFNVHDGCTWIVPEHKQPYPEIREVVEKEWDIWGETITTTATWAAVDANGQKRILLES